MPGRFLTLALTALAAPALAAAPPAGDDRSALIGQPVALTVSPAAVTLTGPRAGQQPPDDNERPRHQGATEAPSMLSPVHECFPLPSHAGRQARSLA